MTTNSLILITINLAIALIFALICFITLFILNKRLMRAKSEVEDFNNRLESYIYLNISHKFEVPVLNIIELIKRLKKRGETIVDNSCLVDLEKLSQQSENLKLLIEGVTSLNSLEDTHENYKMVFGNIISYYQFLFDSFTELAEIKKVDYQLKSNIEILNINYYPEHIHGFFSNLVGKILNESSENNKVYIEITLSRNLKHYKVEFIYSCDKHNQQQPNELDFAILITKKIICKLNGFFEIKYPTNDEIKYCVKLPLSKGIISQPMSCLSVYKPSMKATKQLTLQDSQLDNNINKNIDPNFLSRVTSIIYREITNTENIIEVISSEICISPSQLNRRIKTITGMTTSNFILNTRLNRAKKLLSITQKPIGEIAMECGFNDFAYFSRSFKKEFEITPSAFQRIPHSKRLV